uniref:Uncharacterized protein n=1 Tax=Meloidogyne incognita TaxID=6306 RepID=A0A914NJI1_MELIC
MHDYLFDFNVTFFFARKQQQTGKYIDVGVVEQTSLSVGLTFRWFSFARNLNNLYKKHLKNWISV